MKKTHENGPYPIPTVFFVSYSKFFIIAQLFVIDVCWLYITYSFIAEGRKLSFVFEDVMAVTVWFLLIVLLHTDFVHAKILKKQYLELNESGVVLKTFFRKKSMKWREMDCAKVVPGVRGYQGLIIYSVTKYNPYPKVEKLGIKRDYKYTNISPDRLNQTIEYMKSNQ